MLRKMFMAGLLVLALMFMVGVVGAQGDEVPTPNLQPSAWVAEFGALLGALTFFAGLGTATLLLIKPVLNRLQDSWIAQPNLYLAVVYIIRFLFGGISIMAFGGVQVLYNAAPSLQMIPLDPSARDTAVVLSSMALLSLGSEGLYILWNIGRSLAGLPPMGSSIAMVEED